MITMAARLPKKPPASAETLEALVLVRLSPTEKAIYSALAKKDMRSLSAWVRLAAQEKARAAGAKL